MRAAQRGTEAHHVHVRVLAQDDRALQTGVINLDDAFLLEQLLVQVEQHVQGLAVGVGIPADVVTAGLYLEVGEVEAGLEHLHDVVLHVLTGRAGQNLHGGLAVLDVDDGEVGGGLYHVGIGGDEAHHAVVAGIQCPQDGCLVVKRHLHLGTVDGLEGQIDVVLDELELALELGLHRLDEFLQPLEVILGHDEHGLGLERDGIAHVAAMPAHQTCLVVDDCKLHEACHQLVGVGTALVDLESTVTALESLEGDSHCGVAAGGLHLVILACAGNVDTTGAADDKLAPRLTVQIEQDVALHLTLGQVVGAIHARLLILGDEALDGTVLEGVVLHDRHDGSHAQTVVSTQRGAAGLDPLAVDVGLDGVDLEVVLRLGSLLGHHVHVGLHGDALAVLHARGRGLAHHDVAGGVLEGLHAHLLGEVEQELLDFLNMSRGTGNLRQRIEVAPDARRFQFLNLVHFLIQLLMSYRLLKLNVLLSISQR